MKKLLLTILGFALVGLVGFLDYKTGYELSFAAFYLFPIALVAWTVGRNIGFLLSVVSAIVWYVADQQSGHVYSEIYISYWNAGIRLVIFLVVARLVAWHKEWREQQWPLSSTCHPLERWRLPPQV